MVSFDDHFKVANFEFVILMPVLYQKIVEIRMILEILLNQAIFTKFRIHQDYIFKSCYRGSIWLK